MKLSWNKIRNIVFTSFIYSYFIINLRTLYHHVKLSDWHDFDVFYEAASSTLTGTTIYKIFGPYELPFWYPPWTAWFFIPFAIFQRDLGLFLYQVFSLFCAISIVIILTRYYQPDFNFRNTILILSFMVPMSLQLILVGQMDYIFLFFLVSIIWAIEKNKDSLVGILFPFLLTKPHLIIPFSIYLFLRAGKRAIGISVLISTAMLVIETILSPNWYLDYYYLFLQSGIRTDGLDFVTFPSFLGLQENWMGTANLPITIFFILATLLILWKYRNLPPVPFFSVAIVASMVCAPRAYAYDLPLLVPAVIWLTAERFRTYWWLWVIAGIYPIIVSYSSYTFGLVLIIFVACIYKLEQTIKVKLLLENRQVIP